MKVLCPPLDSERSYCSPAYQLALLTDSSVWFFFFFFLTLVFVCGLLTFQIFRTQFLHIILARIIHSIQEGVISNLITYELD